MEDGAEVSVDVDEVTEDVERERVQKSFAKSKGEKWLYEIKVRDPCFADISIVIAIFFCRKWVEMDGSGNILGQNPV